jgi:hypothetical protein
MQEGLGMRVNLGSIDIAPCVEVRGSTNCANLKGSVILFAHQGARVDLFEGRKVELRTPLLNGLGIPLLFEFHESRKEDFPDSYIENAMGPISFLWTKYEARL